MTKTIHIHIHRAKTSDAGWDESKHKRADNGQFGSGGGGAKPAAKKASAPATKSSGLSPEKARSLSQIDKLERSVAMMEARKPTPAQKVAHARELSDLKAQYARKLAAHEAAHGKIEPSDWSQLKESSSRTNETKLENENVARYGKVKG